MLDNGFVMKTTLYIRVSTGEQNCDLQLAEMRDYAARRGWPVSAEYVDQGVSRAKSSRPALDRLMADAAQRRFDGRPVVIVDLHKLYRMHDAGMSLRQIAAKTGLSKGTVANRLKSFADAARSGTPAISRGRRSNHGVPITSSAA
jgi:DNA invertase Pin-like site-specific DNA recombinase